MNKNIFITLVLILFFTGFIGVVSAKNGSDDEKSSSSQEVKSDDDDSSDDSNSGLEIEADIFTNETVVKVEINDNKDTFITSAKTRAEITAEILVKYPTLTSVQVESALKIETEDRSSRPSDSVSIRVMTKKIIVVKMMITMIMEWEKSIAVLLLM